LRSAAETRDTKVHRHFEEALLDMGLIRKALSIATVGLSDRLFEDDSKKGRTAKTDAKRGRTQKQRSVTRTRAQARPKPKARRKPQARPKPQALPKPQARPKRQARRKPQARPQPQAVRTSPAPATVASGDGTIVELERLADLRARGALTNEEFTVAKAKILGTTVTPREPDTDAATFPAVEANVAAARQLADLAARDDASVTTLSSD
jgi:hypothetical protein